MTSRTFAVSCTVLLLVTMSKSQIGARNTGQHRSTTQHLKLIARSDGSANGFPLSKYFVATLENSGNDTVSITAIQMPGGYLGSGQFFGCALQVRNHRTGLWENTYEPNRAEYEGGKVEEVNVDPGRAMQVCKMLLPQQAGRAGDTVRFTLSISFDGPPLLYSEPFTI